MIKITELDVARSILAKAAKQNKPMVEFFSWEKLPYEIREQAITERRLDDLTTKIIEQNLSNPDQSEEFMALPKDEKEYVYENWARHMAGEPPIQWEGKKIDFKMPEPIKITKITASYSAKKQIRQYEPVEVFMGAEAEVNSDDPEQIAKMQNGLFETVKELVREQIASLNASNS